jgi:integrase/recombinase XerD
VEQSYKHTNSERTKKTYEQIIQAFRSALQSMGLDLDTVNTRAQKDRVKAVALAYAEFSARGKPVSLNTINHRLSVLSSFYAYCQLNEWLDYNPIAHLQRSKVQPYASVKSLPFERVTSAFLNMDYSKPEDRRDSAILQVLLETCRRVSELAGLQLQHLTLESEEKVTVFFARCKGNKTRTDVLSPTTSKALLRWLHGFYGPALDRVDPSTPVWVSLDRKGLDPHTHESSYGHALSIQAIGQICKKHLGTSRVHATRHTGTKMRLEQGASVTAVKEQLMHSSLHTTTIYAGAVQTVEDPYAEQVASAFGFN